MMDLDGLGILETGLDMLYACPYNIDTGYFFPSISLKLKNSFRAGGNRLNHGLDCHKFQIDRPVN